jgi:hypothetical protein
MADFNTDVWGKFIEGVKAAMGAGAPGSQLQVFGAPVPFDWGVATGNTNPLEYWNFCDQLPKWSEVGGYIPQGGSLVNSYQSWLNNLKQDYSQALKTQIAEAQQKLAADVATINTWQTTTGAAWQQYVANQAKFGLPPGDFKDWLASTGGDLQQKSLLAQVQKDNNIIASLLAQQNREYSDAWAAFNKTDFQRNYTDASNNVLLKRIFEWSTNPTDLTQKLRAGTQASGKTISFSHSSASHDFSKSWAGASAGYSNWFWSVNGGGAWTRMNQQDAADSYSASITFKDLTLVTVNPDTGWFDDGYLKTKADGPYVDTNSVGYGKEATGNQTYFFQGEKATLPAQLTGMLVGYQPSFQITLSASSFSEAYEKVEASGGLRIGPFTFGGSGGHESDVIRKSAMANTIEGQDKSNVPSIFGIYLKVLP